MRPRCAPRSRATGRRWWSTPPPTPRSTSPRPRPRRRAAATRSAPPCSAAACAAAGIPLIHISTDYVFDGSKAAAYRRERPDRAAQRLRAQQGRGRARGARGGAAARDPAHVLGLRRVRPRTFSRPCCGSRRRATSCASSPTSAAARPRRATSPTAILAIAPRLDRPARMSGAPIISPASGVTTWHGFASRIVAAQAPLTGRTPRVTAITTADFPTPARRPANSRARLQPVRARLRLPRAAVDRGDRSRSPRHARRRQQGGTHVA